MNIEHSWNIIIFTENIVQKIKILRACQEIYGSTKVSEITMESTICFEMATGKYKLMFIRRKFDILKIDRQNP